MVKRKDELTVLADRIERTRNVMARTLMKQLDAEPELAQLVAQDAIRMVLAPTRSQLRRAWWKRKRRAVILWTGIPATIVACTVGLVGMIVEAYRWWPSSYPRQYAVADTWRPYERRGSKKVDSKNGVCFVTESDETTHSDCLAPAMGPDVDAALDKATHDDLQGNVWEGPNGNGEHWVITRAGRRLTITATEEK